MTRKLKTKPFHVFAKEYQEREESKGRIFPGGLDNVLKDPKCSEEWNALPQSIKDEYKQDRIETKVWWNTETIISTPNPWINSQLVSSSNESTYSIVEKKSDQDIFNELMNLQNEDLIYSATINTSISNLSFFMIHMNYFYTKINDDLNTEYIPAEFAVIKFSLVEGQKKNFHKIIKTKFEIGYAREATEVSLTTHRLYENMSEGEENYLEMFNKLVEFLKISNENNNKVQPIYTSSKITKIVSCVLKRLTNAAGVSNDFFSLNPLESLFRAMMFFSKTDENENEDLIFYKFFGEKELESTAFRYKSSLACDYHLKYPNNTGYCSLSIVRQWLFIICKYCCPRYNIKMIRGLHKPDPNDNCSIYLLMKNLHVSNSSKYLDVKSATGVSINYENVYNRTPGENKKRKNTTKKLEIIDHSKITENDTIVVPSTQNLPKPSVSFSARKGWNIPKPVNQSTSDSPTGIADNNSFPALGSKKYRK